MAPKRLRLFTPRHLLATALVFLLLGGAGTTLLGAAKGAQEEAQAAASPTLQEPVSIPYPAEGDRGVYEFSQRNAPELAQQGNTSVAYGRFAWSGSAKPLQFEFGEARIMANRTGGLHQSGVLLTSQADAALVMGEDGEPVIGWANETYYVYLDRPLALGQVTVYERNDAAQPNPTAVPGVPLGTHQTNSTTWMVTYGDFSLPLPGGLCGIISGFQGNSIALDGKPIAIESGCPRLFGAKETVILVEGIGGEPGSREVRLRAQSAAGIAVGWLVLREGTPYPLSVETPASDGNGETVVYTWSLTGLDRGVKPMEMQGEATQLPGLELKPRPLWTMDDTGVEHPFPLSVAFGMARDSEDYPDLREFLAKHPDAYTAWARYVPFTNGPFISQRWDFGVTDGKDSVGTMAIRDTGPVYVLGFGVPGTSKTSFRFESVDDAQFSHEAGWLDPKEMPDKVPTAKSLLQQWKAYASPGEAENPGDCWEFYFARDPDGQGGDPGTWMAAGHSQRTQTWDTGFPITDDYTVTWSGSMLGRYDGWDHVDRLDEGSSTSRRTTVGQPTPVPPSQSEPVAPTSPYSMSAVLLVGLGQLTPTEAATIGAGALLASLLYWLWPALKSGPLLLFSRLRGDELLQNALRAQLMARIEAEPGVHHQELVRVARSGNGSVEHHLDRLVAAGLVVRHRTPGFTCYFARGATDRRAMAAAPLLKSPVARAIVQAARTGPGVTPSELAVRLHVSAPTIHYHVERLRNAGILEATRRGNITHLSSTGLVQG